MLLRNSTMPQTVHPARRGGGGANHDIRAALLGVNGIQYDETRIIDPAIGIFEGKLEIILERHCLPVRCAD